MLTLNVLLSRNRLVFGFQTGTFLVLHPCSSCDIPSLGLPTQIPPCNRITSKVMSIHQPEDKSAVYGPWRPLAFPTQLSSVEGTDIHTDTVLTWVTKPTGYLCCVFKIGPRAPAVAQKSQKCPEVKSASSTAEWGNPTKSTWKRRKETFRGRGLLSKLWFISLLLWSKTFQLVPPNSSPLAASITTRNSGGPNPTFLSFLWKQFNTMWCHSLCLPVLVCKNLLKMSNLI